MVSVRFQRPDPDDHAKDRDSYFETDKKRGDGDVEVRAGQAQDHPPTSRHDGWDPG